MSPAETVRDDLDYVVNSVRREDRDAGTPSIYFLWAVLVAVGFALPDVAPRYAGPYWFVVGIGGGLLSWWLGNRDDRQRGINNRALGRRYGLHWLVAGIGFLLAALPMMTGLMDPANGATLFLLVGGISYTLAGIHLARGIAAGGIIMFIAYVVLILFHPPMTWTISGLAIAVALVWSGIVALRSRAQA